MIKAIKYIILLCISVFCFTFTNCSKDNIDIDIINDVTIDNEDSDNKEDSGNQSDSDNSSSSDNSALNNEVTLSANILSMITKASSTSPIGTDRYVDVYVYTSNQYYNTYHYISSVEGSLTPTLGSSEMTLPSGAYAFYTAGVNTVGINVPEFDNNITTKLSNGIDYVWTSKMIVVTDESQDVNLVLNHRCIQIVIQVEMNNITLDTSTKPTMTITPSDSSECEWDFTTGKITSATSLSSTTRNMGVTVSTSTDTMIIGQFIMLPLSYSDSITTQFNLILGTENVTRTYSTKLPVYQNEFTAGNSYIYNLELSTAGITFNNVDITNWVDVTVNQEPIIPTQIN